jgi:quercetin dioxygenase-like cupin family protein
MDSIRINFDQIEWDYKSAGMRMKRVMRHGKQLRLVEIGPESGEANWCEEGHVGYVIEGELETNINGSVERLTAGDGLFIPDGKKYRHKSKAVGGLVRLILVEDA